MDSMLGFGRLRLRLRAGLVCTAVALGLVAFGLLATDAAAVRDCRDRAAQPPNVGSGDVLNGVAATSTCTAWAVGEYLLPAEGGDIGQTLVEHWNGTAWSVQPSPSPGEALLNGAAATSPTNAWAVGDFANTAAKDQTLVERWNGTAWKLKLSPNPGGPTKDNYLAGVAATSATNAWAVGFYSNGTADQTLIEHWNGTAWKVELSPNRGSSSTPNDLTAVAATSPKNAWAVGDYLNKQGQHQTLIEHWDGTAWKVQPSPNPGDSGFDANVLSAVAATSRTDAWAVGHYNNGTDRTLIEHWNGTAWKVEPSPTLADFGSNGLFGVAAISATDAWAVGFNPNGIADRTLVEHWNGTDWKVQPSANPGGPTSDNQLLGVAATSATSGWAVGFYDSTAFKALAMRCC